MEKIDCRNLTKEFAGDGTTTVALEHINLSFKKGEFTAIIGHQVPGSQPY